MANWTGKRSNDYKPREDTPGQWFTCFVALGVVAAVIVGLIKSIELLGMEDPLVALEFLLIAIAIYLGSLLIDRMRG